MDKSVMVIMPPETDDESAYVMIVYRPTGTLSDFGLSSVGTPVPVDFVKVDDTAIRGYRGHEGNGVLAVQVPKDTPYIVIPRSQVKFMTPLEAAAESTELRDQLKRFTTAAASSGYVEPPEGKVDVLNTGYL